MLKKQDPAYLRKHDVSSCATCSSPASRSTSRRPAGSSESARRAGHRPLLADRDRLADPVRAAGVEETPRKFGQPSFPVYGYDLRLLRENDGERRRPDEKGVLAIVPPLPPGCMTTVWGDDERFVNTYFSTFPDKLVYSTFDWGIRDEDGYYFILGRTDDVINVAGHRLGTREIEEAVQAHPGIAEVAVVGVADPVKGQMPLAFAVVKDAGASRRRRRARPMRSEVMDTVDQRARRDRAARRVHFVTLLPKTRSGKLLRRSIQALAEDRDPGDLTTIEDPNALEQIRQALR